MKQIYLALWILLYIFNKLRSNSKKSFTGQKIKSVF